MCIRDRAKAYDAQAIQAVMNARTSAETYFTDQIQNFDTSFDHIYINPDGSVDFVVSGSSSTISTVLPGYRHTEGVALSVEILAGTNGEFTRIAAAHCRGSITDFREYGGNLKSAYLYESPNTHIRKATTAEDLILVAALLPADGSGC